ncbi:MAG: M4 family metallopeptidase [Bacteroidetes bacterium]|nr:M4 family metallopeptidase [Bacteroidota bacterium]
MKKLIPFVLFLCAGNLAAQSIHWFNVSYSEQTGLPRWAETQTENQITEDAFFQWLTREYVLPPESEFRLLRSDADELGFVHKRFVQYYKAKPVQSSMLILHLRDGWVESFNGDFYNQFANNFAGMSASAARDRLLAQYGNVTFRWQVPAEEAMLKSITGNPAATWYPASVPVVWYAAEGNKAIPCYAVHVAIANPRQDETVMLDIRNGTVAGNFPMEVHSDSAGKANTWYEGVQNITADFVAKDSFRLRESGKRNVNTYKTSLNNDYFDKDNYWNTTGDRIAGDVHWGGELVSDFMKKFFNKNSYDGKGGAINLVTSSGSGNAFWNLGSNYATFLVGSSGSVGPCAALDVVGHEMGHGIADEISGLLYSGEACALHESFADINGHMTEFMADSAKANWWLGEKVWSSTKGIRYMRDPWQFKNPKAYGGQYWPNGCHGSGGVQNYWYYLMTVGDTGTNEFGYNYKLSGLGHWKAAQITYRGYFYYMVPAATFKDACKVSIKAAKDLYGGCSNEINYVFAAWKAVNVEDTSIKAVDLTHGINTASLLCNGTPVKSSIGSFGDMSRKVSWLVDKKDTSTQKSFSYTFHSTGVHTVHLTTNTCGKIFYDSARIVVNYRPVPAFTKPFDTTCAGTEKWTFTNTTVNADKNIPLKFYWYINPGGNWDTSTHLKTNFPLGLDYEIELKAYYPAGCWATTKTRITSLEKPHPSFSIQKNVCQNRPLKFTNTSDTSTKPTFKWYFPDTTIFSGFVPPAKSLKKAGTANIVLEAVYLGGKCTDTAQRTVLIYQNPKPDFYYSNNCRNKTMTLMGTGTFYSAKQWNQWHFGHSNPIMKDTFLLKLEDSSARTIGYTAGDANGCQATVYKTIPLGLAKAAGSVTDACAGDKTIYTNNSTGDPDMVSDWLMGDGMLTGGGQKFYTYPTAGVWTSSLIVISGICTDTLRIKHRVYPSPSPEFTAPTVCADQPTPFQNNTPGKDSLKHKWYFADGDSSEKTHPLHQYNVSKTTTYAVQLQSLNSFGCSKSITKQVNVVELPICGFTASVDPLNPATIQFSPAQSGTVTSLWHFGDGDSSIQSGTLKHTYKNPGKFTARLKLTNPAGCSCTESREINAGVNQTTEITAKYLRVYPNPAHGYFILNNTGNETISVHLYDSKSALAGSGKLMPNSIQNWDVQHLTQGIYWLIVDRDESRQTIKLVIQK